MARKKDAGSASTPATLALAKLGIDFAVRAYEHDPAVTDFGGEAAAAQPQPGAISPRSIT